MTTFPLPGVTKPNLAALQTAFTGRLYAWDMITLYRALSGRYSTYPSVLAGGLGLSLQQDLVTFVGAFGPVGRFHFLADLYSVEYNDQIERDLFPLSASLGIPIGFWTGWRRFTQLLREDAAEVGEPLKAPGLSFDIPTVVLDPSGLSPSDKAIYAIYRGDVDSMELLLTFMSIYMPESVPTMPLVLEDLKGIFGLYAEWVREQYLGMPASAGARIMAKVIFLADYRWYLLAGDLLNLVEPIFRTRAFSDGINVLGTLMRTQAERIRI